MGDIFNECIPGKRKQYSVVSELIRHPELGEYQTYGISVTALDFVGALHDVSVCRETVESLVKRFNQSQLSTLHLNDVVADMLP